MGRELTDQFTALTRRSSSPPCRGRGVVLPKCKAKELYVTHARAALHGVMLVSHGTLRSMVMPVSFLCCCTFFLTVPGGHGNQKPRMDSTNMSPL